MPSSLVPHARASATALMGRHARGAVEHHAASDRVIDRLLDAYAPATAGAQCREAR